MRYYLIFRGDSYYPGGGWEDHAQTLICDTDAKALAEIHAYLADEPLLDDQWLHAVVLSDLDDPRTILELR